MEAGESGMSSAPSVLWVGIDKDGDIRFSVADEELARQRAVECDEFSPQWAPVVVYRYQHAPEQQVEP